MITHADWCPMPDEDGPCGCNPDLVKHDPDCPAVRGGPCECDPEPVDPPASALKEQIEAVEASTPRGRFLKDQLGAAADDGTERMAGLDALEGDGEAFRRFFDDVVWPDLKV